jgi:hypothetical protein
MKFSRRVSLRLLAGASLVSCSEPPGDDITRAMRRIMPLFKRKTAPLPGDWLAEHKEAGQSYQQFHALVRQRAVEKYSTLRLVPIGPLSQVRSLFSKRPRISFDHSSGWESSWTRRRASKTFRKKRNACRLSRDRHSC